MNRDGAVLLGWTGDNGDPDNFLAVLLGCDAVGSNNRAQWCNKEFDDLIQKAKVTADQAERTKLYEQAQVVFKQRGAVGDDRPFGRVHADVARRSPATRWIRSARTASTASTSPSKVDRHGRPMWPPVLSLMQIYGTPYMSDTRLDVLHPVLRSTGLDAIAIVPGANFRRIFHHDFHQNERPLVVIARRGHAPVAIVPNLEMGSFAALDFKGEVYDWRDETGYNSAFEAAARHLDDVRTIGVEGQTDAGLRGAGAERSAARRAARRHPLDHFIDPPAQAGSRRRGHPQGDPAVRSGAGSDAWRDSRRHDRDRGRGRAAAPPVCLRFGRTGLRSHRGAAGDNSAKPHAKARPDYRIKRGDSLLFDFGGAYGGYCADITRTFFVQEVSARDRDFYNTVLAANEAGRAASRPGATAHHVDDVVQKVLEGSPFAQYRRHKTGHGLGLEVHEDPYIMRGNHNELEPGMVFTVEPGLYRMGEAGVRIEDDMLVTAEGAESLTSFPRELRLVG